MHLTHKLAAKKRLLLTLLFGLFAGFINGLLGAGGGILLVYAFAALNPDKTESGVRDNFSATIASILPISLFSAFLYAKDGRMDAGAVTPLILPALLGGFGGALLLGRIPTGVLKKIFAILVIYSGISMVLR